MNNDSVEYCYSWDNKRFDSGTFGSIEEALADAAATDEQRENVYVGEAVLFKNSAFYPDAGWVLEHMGEQAWGEVGEYSEDYPDVSKEARDELNELLSAMLDTWCEKHGVSPQFYRVSNSKCYPMPVKTE